MTKTEQKLQECNDKLARAEKTYTKANVAVRKADKRTFSIMQKRERARRRIAKLIKERRRLQCKLAVEDGAVVISNGNRGE